MPMFIPKPRASTRGVHPDLDSDGNFMLDALQTPNVEDREFDRKMRDPVESAFFIERVAAAQSLEPEMVQRQVGGETYGAGSTPSQGYREYIKDRDEWRAYVAGQAGKSVFVDDADVARMSLEEYDQHFDANGRPKPHVYHWRNRSVWLNDQIDQASAREMGSNR